MSNPHLRSHALVGTLLVLLHAVALRGQESRTRLGPGPAWRGPIRPLGANEVFATGNGCAMCHSASPHASAMRSATGDDVSPHGLWQATMMANSFRDPYWRAQVARESHANPDRAADIQALCIRCHAPMAHHTARLGEDPSPLVKDLLEDPLAKDGVSCTVCHQIQPEGLGTVETFSGRPVISRGRRMFGPYPDPATGPMRMHTGFTPTESSHVRSAALCGSCHTLTTSHTGSPFHEQTPYLEWRNSVFENEITPTATSKTCQQCHMPSQGSLKIARNPPGRDFNIPLRPDYAAHVFVGGNAFMLDLLRTNATELGVTASPGSLERLAQATRRQLADETVRLVIGVPRRIEGRLEFAIRIENLTGHKFPTGYPARRASLQFEVRDGAEVLFKSGAHDDHGRLEGVADERAIPHRDVVSRPEDVVVYECVPVDTEGRPTTLLTSMARMGKDNRLLPKGWHADGPHASETAPVGTEGDKDFAAGGDTVHVKIPLATDAPKVTIVAWMRYQPVPPAWVEGLRSVDADEARLFTRMYDAADQTPSTAGLAIKIEE